MKPLISLVMILKNEVHCIAQTLESVKKYINKWVILDTGSTDGTQEKVKEILHDIPGQLFEGPFVNFAVCRNQVLDLHDHGENPAVYTLMLSADEIVEGGEVLRKFLEQGSEPAYSVEIRAEHSRWFYPRVLRTGAGWKYFNEVHEVPLGPNQETHGPIIPGVIVHHKASDPDRRVQRILNFDLPTLTRMVDDETKSLQDRAQAIWFLAQTYEAVSEAIERIPGSAWIGHKMMAMSLYWRRFEIGGVDQTKANYALFRFFNIAERIGFYTNEELFNRLLALSEIEPNIPEIYYMLAVHAAQIDARRGLFYAEQAAKIAKKMLEGEPLHIPTDLRLEWLSLRIAAGCADRLKRHAHAKVLAERAIQAGGPKEEFIGYLTLPDEEKASATLTATSSHINYSSR